MAYELTILKTIRSSPITCGNNLTIPLIDNNMLRKKFLV